MVGEFGAAQVDRLLTTIPTLTVSDCGLKSTAGLWIVCTGLTLGVAGVSSERENRYCEAASSQHVLRLGFSDGLRGSVLAFQVCVVTRDRRGSGR